MHFTTFACYNEKPNIDFCVENGVGWYAPNRRAFRRVLDEILAGDTLSGARENVRSLDLDLGADDLAQIVVDAAEA